MPRISVIRPALPELEKKKRVAAYARVSMETEMLLHSLSAQVSNYNELIQKNPEWEFAGIYADEGISGRDTGHRSDFNRLLADCDAGKIDMVLVKSISRFARDTVDTLTVTRHLKELGIDVYFERENIHSLSDEGELLLTLLASFAQEESRSISENVKWGIRKRFEKGIPNGHKAPYGYEWDGEMYRAIPGQGDVVRGIFSKYLSGASAYGIAKELSERGITGQKGVPMDDSAVKFILSNPSYTGSMLLQKNFISEGHTRKRNKGELPMYMVEGMFEPLVTQADFEKAQRIREQRADAAANKNPVLTAFSGLVRCGECGCSVSRRTTKYGKKWNCNTRERKGKDVCGLWPVYESELEQAAASALGLDGYIADSKGGVDWLNGQGNDDENIDTYSDFSKTIDTILMGWNTYHQIVTELSPNEWVYKEFTTYVITHNEHTSSEKIRFVNINPVELVKRLKEEDGKDVWICGGANLVRQLVNEDLIDCYYITVIPTLLGSGIRLFENGKHEIKLRLLNTQSYNGMTELIYKRR